MVLIATTFIGLGLAFASKLGDMEGFSLVMNFIIFPVFLLSGALFPLTVMPEWVRYICYIDPLTYGVDGLRGALIGMSTLPLYLDLAILVGICIGMLGLGAYLFEKTEVD
jgi:ABC-2 type transport system permease protein